MPDFQRKRRLVVSEAPKGGLTGRDIAAPYTFMSKALDSFGDGLNEVAKSAAEIAGRDSVTVRKGENGEDIVEQAAPMPIFGDAGKSYGKAAQAAYLSRAQPQLETALEKARLDHPNDPEGFRLAANEVTKRHKEYARTPALRGAIDIVGRSETEKNYRTTLRQTEQKTFENAEIGYKSSLQDLNDRGGSIARQNGVTGPDGKVTPEYEAIQTEIETIYGNLAADPRFKFPPDRVEREKQQMLDRHKAEAVLGVGQRLMDRKTPGAKEDARQFFTKEIWDTKKYNLSPQERDKIALRGLALLEGQTAQGALKIKGNKQYTNELIERYKKGAPLPPGQLTDAIQKSAEMGDDESTYKLQSVEAYQSWTTAAAGAPLPALNRMSRALTAIGGQRADQAMKFFTDRGKTREQAAGIVGNLIGESGLDTLSRAKGDGRDGSDSIGIGQWNSDRAKELHRFAAAKGKPWHDFETQLEFLHHELENSPTERKARDMLNAARTPEEATRAMLHFERPKNYDKEGSHPKRYEYAKQVYGRTGNVEYAPFDNARRQELINDITKKQAASLPTLVQSAVNALSQGHDISPETMTEIADAVLMTGENQHIVTIDNALAERDAKRFGNQMPAPQRQEFRQLLEARAGTGIDEAQRKIVQNVVKSLDEIDKNMKETPYSTGGARGIHEPPGPLDFANPGTFAAEVERRGNFGKLHTQLDELGPQSVFEAKTQEDRRFGAALTSAKPDHLKNLVSPLYKLDDGRLFATLDQPGVKAGIQGLIRTRDPDKMREAMPLMDALYRRDPAEFSRVIGEKDTDRMRVWQTSLDYMTPEQIAKKMEKLANPQAQSVADEQHKAGLNQVKDLTAAQVATRVDPSWFSAASKPSDEGQRSQLVGDYRNVFAGYYQMTDGDVEQSHTLTAEKIKTKWTKSEVTGELMRHAPDTYYPKFGGNFDWIKEDIEKSLEKDLGPRRQSLTRLSAKNDRLDWSPYMEDWSYTLVPDVRTASEAAAGLPPSYIIMYRKANDNDWQIHAPLKEDGTRVPQRWYGKLDTQYEKREALDERSKGRTWKKWFGVGQANSIGPAPAGDVPNAPGPW